MNIVPQLIANGLITGSLYALAASGLALCYGMLGVFNFAHGHFMMLGAYFFLFALTFLTQPMPIALLTSFALSGLAVYIFLRLIVNPLKPYGMVLVLTASLAFATILESLVSICFGVNVQSFPSERLGGSFEFLGAYVTPMQVLIVLLSLILLGLTAVLIECTAIGRRVRALSERAHAGKVLGIDQRKIEVFVFLLAGLLAVVGGILIGYETNLQPYMGTNYTIKAFAAMVLGGIGSIWGAVVGSYILAFLENFSIGFDFWGYSLPASYKDAFAFILILVILLFRPQGLFGTKTRSQ